MSETDPRLLNHKGDMAVTYHWDNDGHYVVNHQQDVEPYLEDNKRYATSGWDGYDDSREFRFIGTIPDVIAYRWLTEHNINLFNPHHQDGVKRLLQDPDYQFLNPTQVRF